MSVYCSPCLPSDRVLSVIRAFSSEYHDTEQVLYVHIYNAKSICTVQFHCGIDIDV